jgi:formylglycine-generating enzyme required for sulfatase activity
MIKKITLGILILTGFSFFIYRAKKFIPPGTVQITETLFADKSEITNQSWVEYMFWIGYKYGRESAEYLATLPDTLVWRNKDTYNEPYVTHYLRHPAYKNYPVVGITYEQARTFCTWRTVRVKEFFMMVHKKAIDIEYRLPNKEEWEFVSNNGYGFFSKDDSQNKLNCLREDTLASETRQGSYNITAPVCSYETNYFGLYDMFGNVSEMVEEKGVSKGGSWKHILEECRAGKDQLYSKSEAWLGFRCVCIVKQTAK